MAESIYSDVHSANKINGLQQFCCNPFFFVCVMGTHMGTLELGCSVC
jgi:hypothetical protein